MSKLPTPMFQLGDTVSYKRKPCTVVSIIKDAYPDNIKKHGWRYELLPAKGCLLSVPESALRKLSKSPAQKSEKIAYKPSFNEIVIAATLSGWQRAQKRKLKKLGTGG